MKHLLFLLLILLQGFTAGAQSGRQNLPLYSTESGDLLPRGFFFAPGISYMWPSDWNRDLNYPLSPDTTLTGEIAARGKIGLYLELGHAHFLPDWMWLNYLDYGLGFKMLRGKEDFSGQGIQPETGALLFETESAGKYSESFVNLFFNANKFLQVSDYNFLVFGAGINADYRVISNRDFEGIPPGVQQFPENLLVQGHLKLGYGFKVQRNLFIIPFLEVPVLGMVPFESYRSTLPYFNSNYRPLLLTVRFQWLSKRKAQDCVGKPTQKTGHELWDPSMRKKRR